MNPTQDKRESAEHFFTGCKFMLAIHEIDIKQDGEDHILVKGGVEVMREKSLRDIMTQLVLSGAKNV